MRIFLIGMMGSGKTTLGRQLAESLQFSFVDLDEFIQEREKTTIAQLFEQEGPEKFRELEREALEAVINEYVDAVIATGGGTPCFFDNMSYMNRYGKSVFLDVPAEEIFKRLSLTDLTARPLLAGKSETELKDFITTTLEQRLSFYKQATFTLGMHGHKIKDLQTLLNIN